jgi:hypothetical protein
LRSDRNPYFFLRKSKNPHVQHWLGEAAHMTLEQITALQVKSDLKRAMLFVHTLGHQSRSASTAELIADHMSAKVSQSTLPMYELWQFDQESFEITCGDRKHMILNSPFVFLKNQDQLFVGHVWVHLNQGRNTDLIRLGHKIGMADQNMYNQQTQKLIQQRHRT